MKTLYSLLTNKKEAFFPTSFYCVYVSTFNTLILRVEFRTFLITTDDRYMTLFVFQ